MCRCVVIVCFLGEMREILYVINYVGYRIAKMMCLCTIKMEL